MNKQFILINGMHRSGTSFLARALHLSGVYFGDYEDLTSTDLYYDQSNPKGHWENRKMLNLSEKILKENNSSWKKISKIETTSQMKNEFLEIIKNLEEHDSIAYGIKDPRIILFVDQIQEILPKKTIRIGIFRDPRKVAESIKTRDGIDYEKSLDLWKIYNNKLLDDVKRNGGFLLDFDWPKEKLITELKLFLKTLGLVIPINSKKLISEKLKRSDKTFNEKYVIPNDIKELYEKLKIQSEKNKEQKIIKNNLNTEDYIKIIKSMVNDLEKQNEYFVKINGNNKKLLNEIQSVNPIAELLKIYSSRLDLQENFPEVKNGQFEKLFEWVLLIIRNDIQGEEETKDKLLQFKDWYTKYFSGIKNITNLNKKNDEILELNQIIIKNNDRMEKLSTRISLKISEISELENKNKEQISEVLNLGNEVNEKSKNISKLSNYLEIEKMKVYELGIALNKIQTSSEYIGGKYMINFLNAKFPENTMRGKMVRKIIQKLLFKQKLSNQIISSKNFQYSYEFDDIVNEKEVNSILETLTFKPKISIIMPVYNSKKEILSKAIRSVKNQYYTNWSLCICNDGSTIEEVKKKIDSEAKLDDRIKITHSEKNSGISIASNNALGLADGEYMILLDHDDELSKNALLEIILALNNDPTIDFIYSDEDKIDEKNIHQDPFFKPDWSPDLFFSYNYPIHISCFRTSLVKKIGGFRKDFDGSQDYDLILRYLEMVSNIHHIPKILYSWRKLEGSTALRLSEKDYAFDAGKKALNEALLRRNIKGKCISGIHKGTYLVKYKIESNPLISILIPTRTLSTVKNCIESIFQKTSYKNYEIIILDTSETQKIKNFCKQKDKITYKKIELSKFNFSKINNLGVEKSNGDYLIFLNDDTEIISADWIESLLEHAQRKEVGIVGAKLLYPDDRVQHAGTVVGIQWHAGNYGGMLKDDEGYMGFPKIIRNCSSVTAACMMMKRSDFLKIGGFDEKMANSWQDVDLCIRIVESGKSVIFTPFSMLYHYESKTRGINDVSKEELEARGIFRNKHKTFLEKGDPLYNPNFSIISPYKIVKNYSKPIRVLADIYEFRNDLQQSFPNEQKNSFITMIDWAATHGIVADNLNFILYPHREYYFENCSEKASILSRKIKKYIDSPNIQNEFPEVREGEFKKFLKKDIT